MKTKTSAIISSTLAVAFLLALDFIGASSKNQQASAAAVGYVTVPAAAFAPIDNTTAFYSGGLNLYLDSPTHGGWFVAPVYLPHGATLNKVTYYWFDDYDGYETTCYFNATDTETAGYPNPYVSDPVASSGFAGGGSSSTSTFNLPNIDNGRYLYYLSCLLYREYTDPYPVTILYGIRIEYAYPVFAPLVPNGS